MSVIWTCPTFKNRVMTHEYEEYIRESWDRALMNNCPSRSFLNTGELGYDGPLYDRFLRMTDDMLGPSPMHIKYSSYVYDGFCICQTNFPGPIESFISNFTCIAKYSLS